MAPSQQFWLWLAVSFVVSSFGYLLLLSPEDFPSWATCGATSAMDFYWHWDKMACFWRETSLKERLLYAKTTLYAYVLAFPFLALSIVAHLKTRLRPKPN